MILISKFLVYSEGEFYTDVLIIFPYFSNEITNEGLLNVQREESSRPQQPSSEEKLSPSDSQLAESFEHEVQWALKRVKTVQRKTNHLQFNFISQPKPS